MADYFPLIVADGIAQEVPSGSYLDIDAIDQSDLDHGSIGGLDGDDHSQYHTDGRAATWLAANHATTYNHANYDTAYGWGNHASAGYFIKVSDTLDDITTGSTNVHLTTTLKGNYDAAYSHKTTEDALNGLVKCDGASNYTAVADASANWNTAYGWGDHSGEGYLTAESDTLNLVTGRGATTANAITVGGLTNSALTSGRVVYSGASGVLQDNATFTFDGTVVSLPNVSIPNRTGKYMMGAAQFMHNYYAEGGVGWNLFMGQSAGNFTMAAAATYNLAIGAYSLTALTTGDTNTAIGAQAGRNITTGTSNVFIGTLSGIGAIGAAGNIGIGYYSLGQVSSGRYNTAIGFLAGYATTTGYSSIFIGSNAGRYETGEYKIIIDSISRANEADSRTFAPIYGVVSTTVANQDLVFNAQVGIHITPTAWLTLPAGAAGAGLAPMHMTPGTVLSTPVSGAIESDGTHLYWTDSGNNRKQLD